MKKFTAPLTRAYTGFITYFNQENSFGFIWNAELNKDIYFRFERQYADVIPRAGDLVKYILERESADRPRAVHLTLITPGDERIPSATGVTTWIGPPNSNTFGMLQTRDSNTGSFLHVSNLIRGGPTLRHSALYRFDLAKNRNRIISLNAREITENEPIILQNISENSYEDPCVRLVAEEMLHRSSGTHSRFLSNFTNARERATTRTKPVEFMQVKAVSSSDDDSYYPQPERIQLKMGGIEYTSSGSPSDNSVKIVNSLVIGGVALAGVSLLAGIAKLYYSDKP